MYFDSRRGVYMSKYDFMMQVVSVLKTRSELSGATVTCDVCVRNNDTEKHGIIISYGEMQLSSVIYVDDFYNRYQEKKLTIEETADEVVSINCKTKDKRNIDISDIFSWDSCKDRVIFRLISANKNKKYLSNVSYVPFLDLAIMFTLCMDINEDGVESMKITNDIMKGWGVGVQDLMNQALINTPRILPAKIEPMHDVVTSFLGCEPDEDLIDALPMVLVSNEKLVYGATTILYEEAMTNLGDRLGDDFYIIPSSIHEVLVLPSDNVDDTDDINRIINEVNRDHVINEDILSDKVYFYKRNERRFYY